jgi:cyclic pyranopterin phosphate synthase
MSDLSHVDDQGRARMVDVADKRPTDRFARAGATVITTPEVIGKIREGTVAKGPVLETARLAGIQAAKRTWELIPLCHPLPLDHADVICTLGEDRVEIEATARTIARTGVEMEAMTAASVAALTVYDMVKAVDRALIITGVRLLEKSGGRSGHFRRGA